MNIPFSLYIFRKSIKKIIENATILFKKSSTVKGNNLLSKLSHCAPSDIEEQPEYVNSLVQYLVTEMEEIKSKQKTLKRHNSVKRNTKRKKTSKKSSRKSSKKYS